MEKVVINNFDSEGPEVFYEVDNQMHPKVQRQEGYKRARVAVEATEFSGKESENVDDWLYHFERVAVANGWSLEDRLEIAPAFLRGYASK